MDVFMSQENLKISRNSYSNFINSLDSDTRKMFTLTKRFLEIYTGNDQLRNIINMGIPLETIDNNFKDTKLTIANFLPILDPSIIPEDLDKSLITSKWPYVNIWWKYTDTVQDFRKSVMNIGSTGGKTKQFDQWRQRQINRSSFELGVKGSGIVHAPIAFELSDGCSVGCWFCGISAEKFKGHYVLDQNGAQEWKETLKSVYDILGSGMEAGFCYWGTDPLDNPDYLQFLKIYDQIVGVVPQTTTAIPLKNLDLTFKVLDLWKEKKNYPVRFSILTKSILQRVHESFSAEELIGVELVLQNTGAMHDLKTGAGKAFNNLEPKDNNIIFPSKKKNKKVISDATIACVSGFLINIVTKKIRLVTPTLPTTKWKDGFITLSEMSYNNPKHLKDVMLDMIDKFMDNQVPKEKK